MGAVEGLLRAYGAWAVLVGTAVEGDATMILTGVLVHLGVLSPGRAFVMGALGAMLGDASYYLLGRLFERRARHTRAFEAIAPLVERFSRRLGPLTIFAARFVYGTRTATMIFWGIRHLSWTRFFLIDLAGCVGWAVLLGGVGYMFAHAAEQVLGRLRRVEHALLLAILILGPLVWAAHQWMLRRERRARAAALMESSPLAAKNADSERAGG